MAIRKRGNSYWIDFMFNRTRHRKRSPDNSHKGAKAYELLIRNRLARGEPLTEPKSIERQTFKDLALQWLNIYVKTNNKPSEYKIRQYILSSTLIPYFKNKYIDEISLYNIERFKAFLLQEKKLSAKSVNNYIGILRCCLKFAVEMDIIDNLPKIKTLKVPPQKYDFLTPQEIETLLAYAQGMWHDMILLAVRTGLRFGELIGLKWEDINFREATLLVTRNIVRGIEGSPKNNKTRIIPLSDKVLDMLKKRNKISPYIFHDGNSKPLVYNTCLKRLQKISKKAGLRSIGWHTLRHSFASHLAEQKNSIIAIKELLGHTDVKTTMRYAHVNLPSLQQAIASLEPKKEKIVTILSQQRDTKTELSSQQPQIIKFPKKYV
ncbi:MAG: site-specific integrase [Ignavibacteriae bacterium]|nr:MAG: site-specific integrase [Ignavibacteriota bacterium]